MLWYIGEDIFFIFNKCFGGYILGGKIVFIFFNIVEDFGVLFIECDVIKMEIGMVIIIYFYKGKIINEVGEIIFIFILKLEIIFEEVWAGGWIFLLIGCSFMDKICNVLGLEISFVFICFLLLVDIGKGFILV